MKITGWVAACALTLLHDTDFRSGPSWAETILQLGHPTASTSHYGVAAATLADELAKRSNGKFKVVSTPNGAEREMIESAQIGTLDLVVTSTGPVGNFVPEVAIVDIPFLFRDYDHAHAVLDGPIGQDMLKLFPAKGIEALAWGENGFRHITNSKRPINTPADAKGLKVRTMENQVRHDRLPPVGHPADARWPSRKSSPPFSRATIDGQENPIPVIASSKFAKVQKYLTLTGHVYSPAIDPDGEIDL